VLIWQLNQPHNGKQSEQREWMSVTYSPIESLNTLFHPNKVQRIILNT